MLVMTETNKEFSQIKMSLCVFHWYNPILFVRSIMSHRCCLVGYSVYCSKFGPHCSVDRYGFTYGLNDLPCLPEYFEFCHSLEGLSPSNKYICLLCRYSSFHAPLTTEISIAPIYVHVVLSSCPEWLDPL